MPIEWDDSARATRRSTRRTCARRCWPRSIGPAECAPIRATSTRLRARRQDRRGDLLDAVSAARAHGARQRHGARHRRSRGHLDRRSEPAGNALQRRRRSPASPRQNVHLHLCHLGGGFGRNGNGPQAEHAIMIANANRGTPIHMLWTREEDFIGTTYRAMGVARLKAGSRCRRLADRARRAHGDAGRRVRPGRVVRRDLALPRAELSLLEPHDEIPRARRHAARRRPGRARVLSRELHGRARPRRGQGSVSLSARAHRAHRACPTRTT